MALDADYYTARIEELHEKIAELAGKVDQVDMGTSLQFSRAIETMWASIREYESKLSDLDDDGGPVDEFIQGIP